jgi:hypothetical protein
MVEYLPYTSDGGTGTEIPCYRVYPGSVPEAYICETNEHLDDALQQANADRICAAVNACKGLDTAVLERGVVAELRHILGELLTAAGDLGAAIDEATDQFDAERARLDAASRGARALLDAGMGLDLHELLVGRGQIALIWSVEDVQEVRPDLTDEQAWEVLHQVKRKHDAALGVSWLTLKVIAEDLFGDSSNPSGAGDTAQTTKGDTAP